MKKKKSLDESCNIVENVFYSLKGRFSDHPRIPDEVKADLLQFMYIAEPHLEEILKYIRENVKK